MQVTKLRLREENGLVPAGRYFERLAANLRTGPADKRQAEEPRPSPSHALAGSVHRHRATLA